MSNQAVKIAITGIGLTAPNGNSPAEFRNSLLNGVSGVGNITTRHMGEVHAGACDFEVTRHQSRKDARTGTRAGSIAIYCANEAVLDAGVSLEGLDRSRIGVYIGTTEHGNVETENEVHNLAQFDNDVRYWSHHHNPRSISNNPAGEVTVNMGVSGPHYCIGAACAAGNIGVIQGVQQIILGEVDMAIAGGVSESIHTFGIFASFKSQNALASHADPTKASRPMDIDRNGIVVSEGGCLFVLERLDDAISRGATIHAVIAGYAANSDADNTVLPNAKRQAECVVMALRRAGIGIADVDIVNTHGTGTKLGDIRECEALRILLEGTAAASAPHFNNTKGFIGHAMGAAGVLELAGNLGAFRDGLVHPCMNLDNLDPECELPNIVVGSPASRPRVNYILNNSFGMLGINSTLIVKSPLAD